MRERNLEEFKNISNKDLKRLNETMDMIIIEKEKCRISFLFLEHALASYINNNSFINKKDEIEKVKVLKKWEIISIVLDFFKSLDPDIYQKIRNIIFGKNPKIKLNIYKRSGISDFNEEDSEFAGYRRYARNPINKTELNKDIVYLPIRCGWAYDKQVCTSLGKDEGTLEDLFALVHELSHTLDMYLEYLIDEDYRVITSIEDVNYIFTESTAIGFERFFIKYLLENGIISDEKYTENILMERANDTMNKCITTYAILVLSRKKEENGKITAEDVNEVSKELGLGYIEKRKLIDYIKIYEKGDLLSSAGYAFSGMISPIIAELLDKKDFEKLKKYFEASRMGNFKEALESIGIGINDEGMSKLEQIMLEHKYESEIPEKQEEQR